MAELTLVEAVNDALRTELERDRTKTYVVEISPLGLVEMTRQNVTDGPREILTRKCPVCEGDGIVVSDQTMAMQVERRLRGLATSGSRVQAFRVAVHPRILPLVLGPGGERMAAIEDVAKRRFFLVPAENGHIHTNHFEVLAEGKLTDLQPGTPVAEGAELELKLVELGLHDATAAVGKVDGFEVVVAGAAKLVGKKAKIHIGRVLEGQAFATLVVADAPESPITFESEAEKPTRAPARRKTAAEPAEAGPETESDVVEEETEPGADAEPVLDEEADVAEEQAGDRPAPKKRTRRGSRGGRRRKKKPSADAVAGDGGETEAVAQEAGDAAGEDAGAEPEPEPTTKPKSKPAAQRRRTPKVHVPTPDLESPKDDG